MKRHPDPWANLPPSMWPFSSSNSASALQKLDREQLNNPRMVLPTYTNPYCTFSGLGARKFTKPMPSLNRHVNLNFGDPEFAGYQDRVMRFNQSRDQNSLIFSSSLKPSLALNPTNQSLDFEGSNEAVSMDHGEEEMRENTEEINALLYSDSEEEYEEEEETSTGHSPMEPTTGASSEAAVSSVLPVKRKRVDMDDDEPNASLLDTASSSSFGSYSHDVDSDTNNNTSNSGKASRTRGGDLDCKRIKRERILEIIGVLRRIIPCGKGKDAATVLDEAISYLKSLKLKAMALASTTIN